MQAAGQTISLAAGLAALAAILALTTPAMAQPRQIPALDASGLHPGTFDVRAFDPLGMPGRTPPLLAENQTTKPGDIAAIASGTALPREAQAAPAAALVASGGLFSDGWSRDGFGGRSR